MKRWLIFLLLIGMLVLSACKSEVVCNQPYIRYAEGCCLDRDNTNVCDSHEDYRDAGLIAESTTTTTSLLMQPSRPVQPVVEAARSNYLGKKDAWVAVEVYGDAADLYTTQLYEQVLQKTEVNYVDAGKVIVWFFHAPSINSKSRRAAEAVECAGEQGRFFAYYLLVLKNQAYLEQDDLEEYARRLAIDREQFKSCLDSGKYAARVQEDYERAEKEGFDDRIPALVINGVDYPRGGLISLYDYRKLLDEELEKAG